jgi:hypothetical protein
MEKAVDQSEYPVKGKASVQPILLMRGLAQETELSTFGTNPSQSKEAPYQGICTLNPGVKISEATVQEYDIRSPTYKFGSSIPG